MTVGFAVFGWCVGYAVCGVVPLDLLNGLGTRLRPRQTETANADAVASSETLLAVQAGWKAQRDTWRRFAIWRTKCALLVNCAPD